MIAVDVFAGGLFAAATKMLLGGVAQADSLAQYRRLLTAAMPELRTTVLESVRGAYAHLAQDAEQRLTGTHEGDVKASIAALEQAQALGASGDQHTAAARATLEALRSVVAEKGAALAECKQQLWS
jgi:hypothetical protein